MLSTVNPVLSNIRILESEFKTKSLNSDYVSESYYLLDSGDVISLYVNGLRDISKNYRVLNDGSLNIPFVGRINVRNLSIKQAEQLIMERFSEEIINPQIYISIHKPRPIRFNVLGEVEKPGIYRNKNQAIDSAMPLTIVDAIREAGGITQDANLKEVTLIRKLPGGEEYKQAKLNLVNMIIDGDFSQNPYLLDGDIIKLSKGNNIEVTEKQLEITSSNLSPDVVKVAVVGEVMLPGMYDVDSRTTLVQSVLGAGGPNFQTANLNNVDLIRINRDGTALRRKFKIDINQGFSNTNNPLLQNGDIIRINRNALSKISGTISTVTSPIKEIIPTYTFLKLIED